jgi:hypothetical protein
MAKQKALSAHSDASAGLLEGIAGAGFARLGFCHKMFVKIPAAQLCFLPYFVII